MARTCRSRRLAITAARAGEIAGVVVSDSIAAAGLGPGRYKFGRWDIVIGDDMVPRAPDRSHFVGSGITMKRSADNLRDALRLPKASIRRLTVDNPRCRRCVTRATASAEVDVQRIPDGISTLRLSCSSSDVVARPAFSKG